MTKLLPVLEESFLFKGIFNYHEININNPYFRCMQAELNINIDILYWAIDRAGFDFGDFAEKFPKILQWINDEKKPTLKQLETFSKKVHVPFGYLFLKTPPSEKLPIPFYRTIEDTSEKINLNVFDTISILKKRQEWLKEYLTENGYQKLDFIGRYNPNSNYMDVVENIREEIQLEKTWASTQRTFYESLRYFTNKIESAGIIVTFNGIVENNTHRPIKVEDCRGFVLVDDLAPFMFINSSDSKSAQLFTLAHELAHIWIGHSAGFDFRKIQPANNPVEIFCDKIAAELLVPEEIFLESWKQTEQINLIARKFKVSPLVIARRAFDLEKITKTDFFDFYNNYQEELKERKANKKNNGGDFYATTKKRLSTTFVTYVDNAVKQNKLLVRDAYKLTSLKGNTFQNFVNNHLYT